MVVYAGTADGLWKTSNGGAEWIFPRQRLAGLQVTALAIDQQHPSTLYAMALRIKAARRY